MEFLASRMTAFGLGVLLCGTAAADWRAAGSVSSAPVEGLVAPQDGRALVVHGSTSEVYDPAGNSWGSPASLNESHGGYLYPSSLGGGLSFTRLADGRVLLVGSLCSATAAAEIYDPATNT